MTEINSLITERLIFNSSQNKVVYMLIKQSEFNEFECTLSIQKYTQTHTFTYNEVKDEQQENKTTSSKIVQTNY